MGFIRARGEEQKAERIQEIINATLRIYAEEGYDGVTFSKIGKGLSFSRINLYNYFQCKEDVFLLIMLQDIQRLVEDAEASFTGPEQDTEVFIDKWCQLLLRHQRLLTMFSILNTIILRGASDGAHEGFRSRMNEMYKRLYVVAQRALPFLSEEQAGKFVEYQNSFAMTVFPASIEYKATHGISIFLEAGFGTKKFAPQCKPFLQCILQGLAAEAK